MTRPRNYQTEAVIIRKTRLGEADHILTLYSADLGKTQGVARGVRRPRSKMAGHLELLTLSRISLARGRNLDTITGAQTIESFLPLRNDLRLTSCGLYIAELVNQFTPEHVPSPPLFDLLIDTLRCLSRPESDADQALRYFEVHLLGEVGYRPQLQQCTSCRRPLEPVPNYFSPSAGGVLCPACGPGEPAARPLSVNALKVLRFLQANSYDTVSHLRVDPSLARELEAIMRSYIRFLLERDLRSLEWLDTLRRRDSRAST